MADINNDLRVENINSIHYMSIIILILSSGVINFMPKVKVTLIYAVSCSSTPKLTLLGPACRNMTLENV